MFQSLDLWAIIGIILTALNVLWGSWNAIQTKGAKVLEEAGQTLEAIGAAAADGKFTKEEKEQINADLAETKEAVKELANAMKKEKE